MRVGRKQMTSSVTMGQDQIAEVEVIITVRSDWRSCAAGIRERLQERIAPLLVGQVHIRAEVRARMYRALRWTAAEEFAEEEEEG